MASDERPSRLASPVSQTPARTSPVLYAAATVAVVTLAGIALLTLGQGRFLLFHALVETATVAVACALAIVAWHTRTLSCGGFLVFLGVGYAVVGVVDILHTLAYQGMGVFPRPGANLATQLWVGGRALQALTLLIAPAYVRRRPQDMLVPAGYGLALLVLLASILFWPVFPDCFVEGVGLTLFKRAAEVLLVMLFLAAGWLFWRQRRHMPRDVTVLLMASIGATVLSELVFALYASPVGMVNATGHLLKLAAFVLVYRAVVVSALERPFETLFRDLSNTEKKLRQSHDELEARVRKRTHELQEANMHLQAEAARRAEVEEGLQEANRTLDQRVRDQTAHLAEANRELARTALFPSENPHPVMRIGADGTLQYCNDSGRVILEHWGMQPNDRVPDPVLETVAEVLGDQVMRTRREHIGERVYYLDIVPVPSGHYVNLYGRDMTELHDSLARLERSEERYRQAQQAAGIGSWEWDIAGHTMYRSAEAAALLGSEQTTVQVGSSGVSERVHDDDRDMVIRAAQLCLREDLPYDVEYRVAWPDGSEHWLRDIGDVVRDRAGEPVRMAGVLYETTDRKQREERLRRRAGLMRDRVARQDRELSETREALETETGERQRAEEQLSGRERALESVYNIVTSMGDSAPDAVFAQVVENLASLLRVPHVALLEATAQERLVRIACHGDAAPDVDQGLCRACPQCLETIRRESPYHHLVADNSSDPMPCCGQGFRTFVGVPVFGFDDSVLGVLAVMDMAPRMLTETELHLMEIFSRYVGYEMTRQRMERQLRQDESMKALGQLTSGVAHEVRNPLSGIISVTEALFEELGEREELQPFRMHLRRQVDRMSTLMEDLLSLGRPLQRSQMFVTTVSSLLTSCVSWWQTARGDGTGHVTLSLSAPAGECRVLVDGAKMQQVFVNLIDNAVQHAGGEEGAVVVSAEPGAEAVTMAVRDRGPGIAPELLPRLFEPFYTTRKGGTGLGLSIVHHIVHSHGGEVVVENNHDGPGATVLITLPLAGGAEESQDAE